MVDNYFDMSGCRELFADGKRPVIRFRHERTVRIEGSDDRGETWHPLTEFTKPPEQTRGVIDG